MRVDLERNWIMTTKVLDHANATQLTNKDELTNSYLEIGQTGVPNGLKADRERPPGAWIQTLEFDPVTHAEL